MAYVEPTIDILRFSEWLVGYTEVISEWASFATIEAQVFPFRFWATAR